MHVHRTLYPNEKTRFFMHRSIAALPPSRPFLNHARCAPKALLHAPLRHTTPSFFLCSAQNVPRICPNAHARC